MLKKTVYTIEETFKTVFFFHAKIFPMSSNGCEAFMGQGSLRQDYPFKFTF